jgi:hypothetical protein
MIMGNVILHTAAMSKHRTQTAITAYPNGRSLASISGANPADSMDVYLSWVFCYQLEVSATGWSLVLRIPTERGVSECDRKAS